MSQDSLISKIWNYCHTLRDDGLSYGEYLEQLTFMLFLKMADEYAGPPYFRDTHIPKDYNWQTLVKDNISGKALEDQYVDILRSLGQEKGMIGQIFAKAQNRIQDPAKLHRLVQMINQETWIGIDADVKGDIYEGLLQKNAEDVKSGAGQYFTPRPLIQAIVACMAPQPEKTIADPACGTGGFFLSAYDYLANDKNYKLNKDQKHFLKYDTFRGWEIVPSTARMCLMNLFLHNIGDLNSEPLVDRNDSLLSQPSVTYDYVLTNPPFGKKSSMTFTNADGDLETDTLTYNRQDFWTTTSNKQLNFLQHIRSMLKSTGKAAVVLPDNVLFEGGSGETVRKKLMETAELHTILRLPTGVFYAHGVKANVLFFDNQPASDKPWTKEIWFYDLRTNKHFTLKKNPLQYEDLQEFIECYHPQNRNERKETWSQDNPDGRWRKYSYEEILARDKTSLDIFWLKDDSLADLDNLPDPDVLAIEIVENLESVLDSFRGLVEELNGE